MDGPRRFMKLEAAAFLVVIGALALSGCSRQDFSGMPMTGRLSADERALRKRDDKRNSQLEYVATAFRMQAPGAGAEEYLLGPDDRLMISVFALEEPGRTANLERTVAEDQVISLPWIGGVSCQGLTAEGLRVRIIEKYAARYLKDPQVTVRVVEFRSVAIAITGAVLSPGVYYLTKNRTSVLELLAKAGGLKPDAGDKLYIMRDPGRSEGAGEPRPFTAEIAAAIPSAGAAGPTGGPPPLVLVAAPAGVAGSTGEPPSLVLGAAPEQPAGDAGAKKPLIAVDLAQLIERGDLRQNLDVVRGDIITVASRLDDIIYVLGYVNRPGSYPIKNGQRIDAIRAIALAGGLSSSARAQNSHLVEATEQGQRVTEIDLLSIAKGAHPPVYLKAGDTLIVGSSMMARLAEFVRPSLGAGVNYAPVP